MASVQISALPSTLVCFFLSHSFGLNDTRDECAMISSLLWAKRAKSNSSFQTIKIRDVHLNDDDTSIMHIHTHRHT